MIYEKAMIQIHKHASMLGALVFTITLCASLHATNTTPIANDTATPTQSLNPAVSIHEINTMLAFGVIDFTLTSALVGMFYVGNGYKLCAFGKSQAIPIINSAALIVTASGARATLDNSWIAAAGVFSTIQGVINPFRAYLGFWYHFIGGQPLPLMPEQHVAFEPIDGTIASGFSLRQFLSLSHHLDVSETILLDIMSNSEDPIRRYLVRTIVLGMPLLVFASGVVQFGVGLDSAIRAMQ